MNSSATKTLLALLLALRELKVPLSTDEQEVLQNVGRELELDPDYWEETEEGLMAMIKANPALNQLFQLNKAKLDALGHRYQRAKCRQVIQLSRNPALLNSASNVSTRGTEVINDRQT
jgi:hypothetical protein